MSDTEHEYQQALAAMMAPVLTEPTQEQEELLTELFPKLRPEEQEALWKPRTLYGRAFIQVSHAFAQALLLRAKQGEQPSNHIEVPVLAQSSMLDTQGTLTADILDGGTDDRPPTQLEEPDPELVSILGTAFAEGSASLEEAISQCWSRTLEHLAAQFTDTEERAIEAVFERIRRDEPDLWRKLVPHRRKQRHFALAPLLPVPTFSSDRVSKGIIEAVSNAAEWIDPQDGRFRCVYRARSAPDFLMETGYRADLTIAEQLWERLKATSEATIKAHFVLWARAYQQGADTPGKYALLSIPQFLTDIGIRKHKGGFKPERKREAKQVLDCLMRLELAVTYRLPNEKEREVSGAVWTRGFEAQTRDAYADLFGATRTGDPSAWEPEAFSYTPGPWFSNRDWAKHNRYVGRFSETMLQLRTDRDQYAIRLAGYLAFIGRIGAYGQVRSRVRTLLLKTGIPLYRERAKTREKVEAAFDKLCETGIKSNWRYTTDAPDPARDLTDYDLDDPDQIALAFPRDDSLPKRGKFAQWLDSVVEFAPGEWETGEAKKLGERRKALSRSRKRRPAKVE